MTTMRRRKSNGKSKASKIRKLISQGELTPTEISNKVKVSINYVYIIKGQMKQDGLIRALPPADPTAMPVPTSSEKRRVGRPAKNPVRVEPVLESLSTPLPVYTPPKNPFGIETTPPVGLWNKFMAALRKWAMR